MYRFIHIYIIKATENTPQRFQFFMIIKVNKIIITIIIIIIIMNLDTSNFYKFIQNSLLIL